MNLKLNSNQLKGLEKFGKSLLNLAPQERENKILLHESIANAIEAEESSKTNFLETDESEFDDNDVLESIAELRLNPKEFDPEIVDQMEENFRLSIEDKNKTTNFEMLGLDGIFSTFATPAGAFQHATKPPLLKAADNKLFGDDGIRLTCFLDSDQRLVLQLHSDMLPVGTSIIFPGFFEVKLDEDRDAEFLLETELKDKFIKHFNTNYIVVLIKENDNEPRPKKLIPLTE